MKSKYVEVYDKDTNEIVLYFKPKGKIDFQKQVVHQLENEGFKVSLERTTSLEGDKCHWLASNDDYKNLHLWYREKEYEKGSPSHCYSCYNKWILPVDVIDKNQLITFKNRKDAKDYYLNCMEQNKKDSKYQGYQKLFTDLTEYNDSMVYDQEGNMPLINKIAKFIDNEIVEQKTLLEPISYNDYLCFQDLENSQMEISLK